MKTDSLILNYYAFCLSGNFRKALAIFSGRKFSRSSNIARFQKKVQRRFIESKENLNPRGCRDELIKSVVAAYRSYYRKSLLQSKKGLSPEQELENRIRSIAVDFNITLGVGDDWSQIEKRLKKEFSKRGFKSLWGRITPFRSLLVWQKQKTKFFHVPLMDRTQKVKVILLDNFIELGWLHLATFGRYYVGGWAAKNALYCVLPAYKRALNSDAFRVSYLTHEAQHFSDYKRFPGLSQLDLEYRSKLAELIASKKTSRLMRKFYLEAKNDPKYPHSYAAWKLIKNLDKKSSIQIQAARLLESHNHFLAMTLQRS